jgi:hypothetical protein
MVSVQIKLIKKFLIYGIFQEAVFLNILIKIIVYKNI